MNASPLVLALVLISFATPAFGQGAAVIIKQRAKETVGRPPAPAPAPPAGRAATGSAPAPQATAAQASMAKLVIDLATIKSRPQVTPELKDRFANNLSAAALGANKPAAEMVQGLANAVADAIAGKKIPSAEQTQLARELATVLNAAVGSPQFAAALQGVKDVLLIAGSNEAAIESVTKAITALTTKAK